MPVRNGARFLRDTLRGLLDQDFSDFELLIADNASTDETLDVVHEVAHDPRVRLVQHESNIGGIKNFQYVLDAARGRYFAWAAADDVHLPGFLSRCIAALDAREDAVLAHPAIAFIGLDGELLDRAPVAGTFPSGASALDRFAIVTRVPAAVNVIYGVHRTDALRQHRITETLAADRIILARQSLAGAFVEVPEILFHKRVVVRDAEDWVRDAAMALQTSTLPRGTRWPHLVTALDLLRVPMQSAQPPAMRARAAMTVLRHYGTDIWAFPALRRAAVRLLGEGRVRSSAAKLRRIPLYRRLRPSGD